MLPFQVSIQYHARVWGGQRLKASPKNPIGEAWIVHEHNQIQNGEFAGQTLEWLTQNHAQELLGRNATRFPLLIKILDCADWLSIQVHPNDTQAVQLEGLGQLGKTEAWHLLEVENGAELICGVKDGVSSTQLETAIRTGKVIDVAQYQSVQSGETVMMHAGTMHALGPGMLLYEVQQTSDITYRVYDWGRPASAGRALHIEQAVAVTKTNRAEVTPRLERGVLTECPYFVLEKINQPMQRQTANSFHAITVTEGTAQLECAGQTWTLGRFDSLIVPASAEAYQMRGAFEALLSRLP
ncbi:MAG: type I phosphomannose isomerase catalytic subunit [Deinococcales bacterium]